MTMAIKNKQIDKIIYSYTTSSNNLEEENRLLKETVEQLKQELDKFKNSDFIKVLN